VVAAKAGAVMTLAPRAIIVMSFFIGLLLFALICTGSVLSHGLHPTT
jgi:hypothetical protein